MKCLLLALSVALVCGTQDMGVPQTMEDLDVQKVAGTWYSVATAVSDLALPSTQNAALRLYVKELRPTPRGDLEIMVHRREGGRCVEEKILAERTERAGMFNIDYLEEDRLTVLDTDYRNYLFVCTENTAAPARSRACQYLARTPEVDQVAMEQFGRALRLLSIHVHVILIPPQAQAAPVRTPGTRLAPTPQPCRGHSMASSEPVAASEDPADVSARATPAPKLLFMNREDRPGRCGCG
ncbi:beta-lactoglobulin-like [Myotis yumanensis]|uniref:beta-lactoglobulin-like n=1 Tax=Myotis yumanensis TaxID=159337 RepID=UPI0038D4CBF9